MAFHHRKLLLMPASDGDHDPPPNLQISTILLLMFCVVGGAVLVVCYHVILDKFRSNLNNFRRRNLPSLDETREEIVDENHGPVVDHPIWFIRTVGLQQSLIDSITVFKYKRDEEIIEGTECSVCLNEFQEDESLRLLPKCSHAFHIPCIDTWLRSHKNCPLCRSPIVCENSPVTTVEPNLNDMGFQPETHGGLGEGGTTELTQSRVGGENNGALPIEEGKIIADILESNCGVRVKSDLGDHSATVEGELQRVRRSISMDSFPVGNEGCLDTRIVQAKKPNSEVVGKRSNRKSSIYRVMMKSCSFGPSLHKGPVHMKSLSHPVESALNLGIAEAKTQSLHFEKVGSSSRPV